MVAKVDPVVAMWLGEESLAARRTRQDIQDAQARASKRISVHEHMDHELVLDWTESQTYKLELMVLPDGTLEPEVGKNWDVRYMDHKVWCNDCGYEIAWEGSMDTDNYNWDWAR